MTTSPRWSAIGSRGPFKGTAWGYCDKAEIGDTSAASAGSVLLGLARHPYSVPTAGSVNKQAMSKRHGIAMISGRVSTWAFAVGATAPLPSRKVTTMHIAAFLAFMKPGDVYASLVLSDGGHLSHGLKINISGKYFEPVHYPLVYDDGSDNGKLNSSVAILAQGFCERYHRVSLSVAQRGQGGTTPG